MTPLDHARSSAARHGGQAADYLPLHQWLDESKQFFPDFRHRALRHHSEGIFLAERLFGPVTVNSGGQEIPTRTLAEQHVKEDLGRIPTVQDWFRCLTPEPWMLRRGRLLYLPNRGRAPCTGACLSCDSQGIDDSTPSDSNEPGTP